MRTYSIPEAGAVLCVSRNHKSVVGILERAGVQPYSKRVNEQRTYIRYRARDVDKVAAELEAAAAAKRAEAKKLAEERHAAAKAPVQGDLIAPVNGAVTSVHEEEERSSETTDLIFIKLDDLSKSDAARGEALSQIAQALNAVLLNQQQISELLRAHARAGQ